MIELMVTMAIVALLSTTGIWSAFRWQQQQRLRYSAAALRQFLQLQREWAGAANQTLMLSAVSAGNRWHITARSADNSARRQAIFTPGSPDIRLIDITDKLGFYGERNTAWSGHITLGNASGQWRLVISAWGRVRLCRPQARECQ